MSILQSMLSDSVNGSVSSKRVVTLTAFIMCATAFISNLFWKYEVAQFMYESMMYIVLGGLTVTASEKFAPQKKE